VILPIISSATYLKFLSGEEGVLSADRCCAGGDILRQQFTDAITLLTSISQRDLDRHLCRGGILFY